MMTIHNAKIRATLLASAATALFLGSGTAPRAADSSSGNQAAITPAQGVETIIVTGQRYREKALKLKQEAPNIIEIQPVQEIRKLPDVNVAEALQRMPGISLESDTGEGRFINIRGMDADLNGTTFDGVVLTPSNQASPQGGARAVAFDAFPTGIIGSVEIIKSLTPDMDAEGLGGVINMMPRQQAANGDPFLDAGIGSGYEPLRERPYWQGDITAGTTIDTDGDLGNNGPIGILGTYTLEEDHRGIDDLEEGYSEAPLQLGTTNAKVLNNLQYRWYEYHRTRQGVGTTLNWSPDSDNTFFVRFMHAGYEEIADKHHLELQGMDGCLPGVCEISGTHSFDASGAYAVQDFTDSDEHVGNDFVMFGGHSVFGLLKADYRGAWTRGYDNFSRNWGGAFDTPNMNTNMTYDNIDSSVYPTYSVPLNLANPANYTFNSLNNTPSQSFEQEWSGAADFSYPLSFYGGDGILKFGASVRMRELGVSQDQITYSPNIPSLAGLTVGPDQIYYDDHYNIGPALNVGAIEAMAGAPSDPVGDQQANEQAYENDNENVYAGYLEYVANYGPLEVLGGVRYEATDGTYRAFEADTLCINPVGNPPTCSSTPIKLTPNVNLQNYTDFFPSLQTKYTLDDETQFRAAFSTAIARPGFNQITAADSVDKSGFPSIAISVGNPNLKPTIGDSFDATVEHYLPNGGIASVNLFYKYFENYIIPTVDIVNNPGPLFGQTTTNSFANIPTAFAEGTELDYVQKLAFLPDPFDGLGFDGNITFVYAKGDIRAPVPSQGITLDHTTLPQTSPFNYNAELFYEKGPFGIRLAVSYVSRNLFAVGPDFTQDVYSTPRFRLDLGTTYDITDNIQFYFNAKNLTNTLLEFTQTKSTYFPIQREFYGPTYLAGIRIELGAAGSEHVDVPGGGDDD